MALKQVRNTNFYIGLSTDHKPLVGSMTEVQYPLPGSTLYELDTGISYIYDGKDWVVIKNNPVYPYRPAT